MNVLHVFRQTCPDNKVRGANMGPTWVLSAPDGPHIAPMKLAIGVIAIYQAWVIERISETQQG